MNDRLNEKMFEDVVAFSFPEEGAFINDEMTFYKKKCSYFSVNYLSEETSYEKICEVFPTLKEFDWAAIETKVPDGWKHIDLKDIRGKCHLVVKDEYYDVLAMIASEIGKSFASMTWYRMLRERGFAADLSDSDIDEFQPGDRVRFEAIGIYGWTGIIYSVDRNGYGICENICPTIGVGVENTGRSFNVPIVFAEKIEK